MRTVYVLVACLSLVAAACGPAAAASASSGVAESLHAPSEPIGEPPVASEAQIRNATSGKRAGASMGFGTELSSFVQSMSAQTRGTVDRELWERRLERTETAATMEQRIDDLGSKFIALESEREQLESEYENGNVSDLEYRARLSRIETQLLILDAVVDSAREPAAELGANTTRLDQIDAGVDRVRGPPTDGPVWAASRPAGEPARGASASVGGGAPTADANGTAAERAVNRSDAAGESVDAATNRSRSAPASRPNADRGATGAPGDAADAKATADAPTADRPVGGETTDPGDRNENADPNAADRSRSDENASDGSTAAADGSTNRSDDLTAAADGPADASGDRPALASLVGSLTPPVFIAGLVDAVSQPFEFS
ncbi:hypothetical protein [Halegenticoccus soli]|uniref:hypothetical protein n=1 Tax=Halegenticoccus soli TaxID=1985678 RepID=UPI000C6CA0EB|nr:hypothetical protein [Halegenticoccus soli]